MIGETHKRLAGKVAEQLNLGKRETRLLEMGVLYPDEMATFPHHEGKENEIIRNVLLSRSLFLENDDECYHKLGIALHYIQDRWTLRPRIKDAHTSWEMLINSAELVDDSRLEHELDELVLPSKATDAYISLFRKIKSGIKVLTDNDIQTSLGLRTRFFEGYCAHVLAFALLNRPATLSAPILDLNIAYRVSLEISRSILCAPDKEEQQTIDNIRKNIKQLTDRISKLERQTDDEISIRRNELNETRSTVKNFPETYFDKGIETDDFIRLVDFYIVRWGDRYFNEKITSYERLTDIERLIIHPTMDFRSFDAWMLNEGITPSQVTKIVEEEEERVREVRNWHLHKRRVVEKVRIPRRIQLQKFRFGMVILIDEYGGGTQWRLPFEIYVDCPSEQHASYIREMLRSRLLLVRSSLKKSSENKTFANEFVRIMRAHEIKIPKDEQALPEILLKYQKDKEKLSSLKAAISTLSIRNKEMLNDLTKKKEETLAKFKAQTLWTDIERLKNLSVNIDNLYMSARFDARYKGLFTSKILSRE